MLERIILTPFQKFTKIESLSGLLLFGATILALVWANSPLSGTYESLWQHKIGFTTGLIDLNKPLILWINDGLMAIFFFLIGLEIKRELLIGELNSVKKAAFPLVAALGGMLIPVTIFVLLNGNPDTSEGWAVPMATDIAFSLAILQLLGNRVPLSLKIFLTAFAIVDDIGAVLVIAVFYSTGIKWLLLFIALAILLFLAYLSYRKIYARYLILGSGIIVWFLFLKAGIHPTVAGVLLAFTIPIRQKIDFKTYARNLKTLSSDICESSNTSGPLLSNRQIELIDDLEDWTTQVQSPLQHLEHKLHNWVAYFIMPLFALSNAGVSLSAGLNLDYSLMINIALSLILGNLVGISLVSFIGVKTGLTELPSGVNSLQIIGVAVLAGVGFTMSIFIANLAFIADPAYLDSAKMGILAGSLISGIAGYTILRFSLRHEKNAIL
ncbi:MAG: Na+/H+ antiporter NhaA [Bacteroidia bacterium]|nr:MAG: Na+/H+ antiporter NhaA [Bacteroidia bacterium]